MRSSHEWADGSQQTAALHKSHVLCRLPAAGCLLEIFI
jgi:hypothetical protein